MIKVTKLKCLGDHRLHATFSDGTAGEYDFSARVTETGPMIEPLRDPAYFARVFLEDGAPTWPNGFDMCPDWLRREIETSGALKPIVAEQSTLATSAIHFPFESGKNHTMGELRDFERNLSLALRTTVL